MTQLVMTQLLAVASGLAAFLLLGRHRFQALGFPAVLGRRNVVWLVVAVGAGVGAGAAFVVPAAGLLVGVGAGAATGVWWLVARRRARVQIRLASQSVQAACADLADDLRMGRLPHQALAAAASRWADLRPAAVAAELQHDIDQALREIARAPGAEGLRDVAAAWQVSTQIGSGLADVLAQVARLLASRERRARLVETELAAARATALIVSGLPVLVLGMGSGLGSNPWVFFVHGVGPVVLAFAVALLIGGWAWIDALAARVTRLS